MRSSTPTAGPDPRWLGIDHDELYPRDHTERFRIYGRTGKDLRVLATAPDPAGLGVALVQLHEDAREAGGTLGDAGALGVLDTVEGHWLVSPWHRPEREATVGPLPKRLVG